MAVMIGERRGAAVSTTRHKRRMRSKNVVRLRPCVVVVLGTLQQALQRSPAAKLEHNAQLVGAIGPAPTVEAHEVRVV